MKDQLLDLVQHTYGLGVIDVVKITGTATETIINTATDDRSLVLEAKYKTPVPEFIGTFGMPNLGKLNTILSIPEYRDNAKITLNTQTSNGVTLPSGLHFENASGDFKNDYRFMTAETIQEKIKTPKFKGASWDITITPSVANIQRLKFMSSAHSEETQFAARTEKGDLKFFFGSHSSHAGSFVFASGTGDVLTTPLRWPVSLFLSILGLPGDKTLQISNASIAQIVVDSGIAVYTYMLPAQTK